MQPAKTSFFHKKPSECSNSTTFLNFRNCWVNSNRWVRKWGTPKHFFIQFN